MTKNIMAAVFAVVAFFGVLAFNVKAQTATPTASPVATTMPSAAPSTGFGGR
jgi:hypothetical protein